MSRREEKNKFSLSYIAKIPKATILPPVNWKAINQSAPTRISIKERKPEDPLPAADIVILTWTSAEWFALDHVFLNSDAADNFVDGKSSDIKSSAAKLNREWFPYTRDASGYCVEKRLDEKLWGFFQMVRITDLSGRQWRVLLFKSSSHLAHAPWIEGLTKMLRCIMEDAKPDRVYTIGTSGGARLDQRLGDVVITNATLLNLQRPENIHDQGNGAMHRCPTWFPSTTLVGDVERSLLYNMDQIVTMDSLESILSQIKERHSDEPGIDDLKISDLLNDSIRPELLHKPRVQVMKDVPLLTTDFFYVAKGNDCNAYSFLEMDDAVVAREANMAGVRFACIRNISDPITRDIADNGTPISEDVQTDWSGLIYANFGLQSSYNSALVTWATIAGQGTPVYNPLRSVIKTQDKDDDPLEIKLAFQVRSCGTCSYFWPKEKQNQPYGPYTAFDFDINTPYRPADLKYDSKSSRWVVDYQDSSPWVIGRTCPPAFPDGAIMGGCRKAPIMTIGVNPNLTAFQPSQDGAAWAYPNFSSDNDTDSWTKYAWYYRYRSVYQEQLTLDFIRKFILPDGIIVAPRSGYVKSAKRPDDGPAWKVIVRYDGDDSDTIISLPGRLGDFPYVILFDTFPPHNNFMQGDVIAGRISVPEGIQVEIMRREQNYYKQFVPVLEKLQDVIHHEHPNAVLSMGEEVCQLDMVACASPHWRKEFLGGNEQSADKIVDNCVSQNAWALKQIIQTRPAIIYISGESSWKMFYDAFGAHVQRDIPLSDHPPDREYTLLRETTDLAHPCNVVFDVTVDGCRYAHKTRLVITPHFSYDSFFLPQFRLSPDKWNALKQTDASCVEALTKENGFKIVQPDPKHPDPSHPYDYIAVQILGDKKKEETLDWLKRQFPRGYDALIPHYYEPHAMMASVLNEMYSSHAISWKDGEIGPGYLVRTEGSCQFCVNKYWQFPFECRYGKTDETPPPAGFLERVAEQIILTGKHHKPQSGNTSGEHT